MNEEQAVLDFFSKPENLPLALSVAEQTDQIREQLNTRFWCELAEHMRDFMRRHDLPWQITLTEDRNAADSLVGFNCTLNSEQARYVRPMMEQQNLGKGLQIYFGFMWSSTPTPEELSLPAVRSLHDTLKTAGYKTNESFMAWQWMNIYPRSRRFLLRYTQQPETSYAEVEATLGQLLLNTHTALSEANLALRAAPRQLIVSLDQLRKKPSH